jgi:hypothetical protein
MDLPSESRIAQIFRGNGLLPVSQSRRHDEMDEFMGYLEGPVPEEPEHSHRSPLRPGQAGAADESLLLGTCARADCALQCPGTTSRPLACLSSPKKQSLAVITYTTREACFIIILFERFFRREGRRIIAECVCKLSMIN